MLELKYGPYLCLQIILRKFTHHDLQKKRVIPLTFRRSCSDFVETEIPARRHGSWRTRAGGLRARSSTAACAPSEDACEKLLCSNPGAHVQHRQSSQEARRLASSPNQ